MNAIEYLYGPYNIDWLLHTMNLSDELFTMEYKLDSDNMYLMGGEPYPHPSK